MKKKSQSLYEFTPYLLFVPLSKKVPKMLERSITFLYMSLFHFQLRSSDIKSCAGHKLRLSLWPRSVISQNDWNFRALKSFSNEQLMLCGERYKHCCGGGRCSTEVVFTLLIQQPRVWFFALPNHSKKIIWCYKDVWMGLLKGKWTESW